MVDSRLAAATKIFIWFISMVAGIVGVSSEVMMIWNSVLAGMLMELS